MIRFEGTMPNALIQIGAFIPTSATARGIVFISGSNVSNANIKDIAFITSNAGQSCMFTETGSNVTGRLTTATFIGPGIKTNGFDFTTPSWKFSDNQGIADSRVTLNASYSSGSSNLQTVTASNDYQVPPGGLTVWTSQRFVDDGNKVYRYTGKEPIEGEVTYTTATSVGAASATVGIGVKHNDTLLSASLSSSEIDTRSGLQTTSFIVSLVENDTLSPVMANLTDTTDINVFTVQMQVRD